MRTIKIEGTEYPVLVGYGTVVRFCIKQKIEFYEFLGIFANVDAEKLTNDYFLNLAEFTRTMIERGLEEKKEDKELPDVYTVIDWLGLGNAMTIVDLLFEGLKTKNLKATEKGKKD